MRSKFLYSLLFIVVYLISLVVMLPANYVVKQAKPHASQLVIDGVTGTLWSGEIEYLKADVVELTNVRWSLSPLALLLGEAQLEFISVSSEQSIEGTLELALWGDELELSDLWIRFPISLYEQQLGLAGLDLTGQIDFRLETINYQNGVVSNGLGVLVWRQAGISESLQLGDIQADWQQLEGRVEAALSDLDGPVAIDGSVALDHSGGYQLATQLEVKDNSNVNLKQTIRLLLLEGGRSIGENSVQLERKGRVSMPPWLQLQ